MGELIDFETRKTEKIFRDLEQSINHAREMFSEYRPLLAKDLARIEQMMTALDDNIATLDSYSPPYVPK